MPSQRSPELEVDVHGAWHGRALREALRGGTMKWSMMPSERFQQFTCGTGRWRLVCGLIVGSAQGVAKELSTVTFDVCPSLTCSIGRLRWVGGLIVGSAQGGSREEATVLRGSSPE